MVEIQAAVYFLGALILLVLPLDWFFGACLAAAFHELCHVLAVYLFGGKVYGIQVGIAGAEIQAGLLSPWQERFSVLAGPVGSLLLVSTYRFFPKLALCALIQGVFNLLPLGSLDGARVLRSVLEQRCPEKADMVFRWTERGCVLLLLCALVLLPGYRIFLLGMGILLIRPLQRKIPCKLGEIRVQ